MMVNEFKPYTHIITIFRWLSVIRLINHIVVVERWPIEGERGLTLCYYQMATNRLLGDYHSVIG